MAVKIGSARIDERGKISGGKAGDQTGNEVGTQNWYKHAKGWRVLVCTVPGAGDLIAECMELACKDNNIGYDQWQRNSLWNAIADEGCDIQRLNKAAETDCSALVRLCVAYALYKLGTIKNVSEIQNFNTSTLAGKLLATGYFKELTGSKYTDQSAYLPRGAVLVTRTKGHTVAVLTNGSKAAETPAPDVVYKLGDRILRNGSEGADVKALQGMLLELDYDLGKWGADGDFGDATDMAVRKFQARAKISIDGEVGPETLRALETALESTGEELITGSKVKIHGGNCYARNAPNTSGAILGVARNGDELEYLGQMSESGWLKVQFDGRDAWVSGKYGRLME